MVFRSIWQALQDWANTQLGAGQTGLSDEELKAGAIQDDKQTDNLIRIENERSRNQFKLVALVGCLLLGAFLVLVSAALVVVQAAADLKLPWSRIVTIAGTYMGAPALAALTAWWAKRVLKRRAAVGTTPANPTANPPEGDQNQMAS
ncbi:MULTISPECIES: hypothetical protein [Streptomyces]|uniref:hypothetical protein n=1 Tax=Streptomyces TaxID=1883 RepID=UPI00292F7BF7|nr:hypothetical protein [Streptomyces sp. NEAU-HV9]